MPANTAFSDPHPTEKNVQKLQFVSIIPLQVSDVAETNS